MMISLIIWFYLSLNFFVFAPPLLNINHQQSSLGNLTFSNSHLSNTNVDLRQKEIKANNRTIINITRNNFDINLYRSSWKFIEKDTIRVRFHLYKSLLQSVVSTHFVVRHLHTNDIQTYDGPHEIINSTLALYLHDLKHGRHIVCLLLYRSKLMVNPKHVFCQDIIFNFHKYGQHDTDVDEHKNTFVFLLTQYSIVIGSLCFFQLIHTIRKRRVLRPINEKANNLRNLISEYHRKHHSSENKSTIDINPETHALEYLIYNLNRDALFNVDQVYKQDEDLQNNSLILNHQEIKCEKYLKIPKQSSAHSVTPLLNHDQHQPLLITTDTDEEILDENDFDKKSVSYQSVSHILEENKPWITKLTDNGHIQHTIFNSTEV